MQPFKTLKISQNTSYQDAKKAFLKIAMNNHPDTATVESDDHRKKLRDRFIAARQAFEALVEAPDGSICLKEDLREKGREDGKFDEWFENETGYSNPFEYVDLDPQVMQEVADMTDKMGGGFDRDGGMWTLANMVTSSVKSGGGASVLRLEQGEVKQTESTLKNKRRRRTKR